MRPIFIVGYMGSGKSTLGRKLAETLGLGFVDTDIFLENRFRQRISDMFATVGEEVFRRREHVIAEELSGMDDTVIATGGGLPCYHDNMALLNASGLTIYLEASDTMLTHRLELCKRTRPSVRDKQGDELLEHVRSAMALRRAVYEQAHLKASVDRVYNEDDEWLVARQIATHITELLSLEAQGND